MLRVPSAPRRLPLLAALLTVIVLGRVSEAAPGIDKEDDKVDEKGDFDGCSQACQCHYIDDNLSVHCVDMNLASIPADLPVNITILDLSMNNIAVINSDAFPSALPFLHHLDLRMNGLSDIKIGAWEGVGHLEELWLDHNELLHLQAGMFSGLTSMSVLSMNNNKIGSIENATFDGLVLKHLNLYDNNLLHSLDAGLFSGASIETLSLDRCAIENIHMDSFIPLAKSLKHIFWSHNLRPLHLPARLLQGLDLSTLWLSGNKMTDFRFLSHTMALDLDLSDNPVEDIDLGEYLAMEQVEFFNLSQTQLKNVIINGGRIMFNLQVLDISDNFLRNIDGTLFQRMPSLTQLDVSGNQLHYIGASLHLILNQLEFWDLTGNRLLCDCRLEWFRRWASSQNKTRLMGAMCGLPEFGPVVGAPEFTCDPPTILRISSDAKQHIWHLQCDAEGWPTPQIAWSYNISRHLAIRVEEQWIAFHGHPFRNSSMLVITDLSGRYHYQRPTEYCYHFVCSAFNSEGHDYTEYVHCAEHQPRLSAAAEVKLSHGSLAALDEIQRDGMMGREIGRKKSQSGDLISSHIFSARRSGQTGEGTGGKTQAEKDGSSHPRPGASVSVGLSSTALICLLALGLLGGVLCSRRRGERHHSARTGPGWTKSEGSPGEGLTDSTKCLVEHSENAEKTTFSMDTV